MRPIKFRGRDYFTGEWHYGFYLEDEDGVNIFENKCAYLVGPDSVAQLVGYDKDGNEVYEGDTVQSVVEHGIATVYTAELHAAGRDSAGLCHYNFKDTRLLTEAEK